MSTDSTKKWVLCHFKCDDEYVPVNSKDRKNVQIEDRRAKVNFPGYGWCWGDILAESGKVEIHEIFLPLSKYHWSLLE